MALSVALSMIVSLLLTLLIETTCALLFGVRGKKNIRLVMLVNVFTNPIVVFTINMVVFKKPEYYVPVYVLMEIFAFVSEGLIYEKKLDYHKMRPAHLSVVLNGISVSTGLILSLVTK